MIVGSEVQILAPFDEAFPGTFVVESINEVEGGTVVMLQGVESAFDPLFLKEV